MRIKRLQGLVCRRTTSRTTIRRSQPPSASSSRSWLRPRQARSNATLDGILGIGLIASEDTGQPDQIDVLLGHPCLEQTVRSIGRDGSRDGRPSLDRHGIPPHRVRPRTGGKVGTGQSKVSTTSATHTMS